jgi:feruloyl esterase
LIVAQRFPQDYDGVFAQVPANTYVQLAVGDPLARAKLQAGDGWIPPAKVSVVAQEVRRQCDALDGIEDGLVSNYVACNRRFDPAVTPNPLAAVRCAGGADTGETCSPTRRSKRRCPHAATAYPFALDKGGRRLRAGGPAASRT